MIVSPIFNSSMEKIFITVLILYVLFVAIYFVRANTRNRRKKNIVGAGSDIPETEKPKVDIVGKSTFDINLSKPTASKPEPLAASSPETEKETEKPDTFAPSEAEKPSAEVPQEELDDVFSDAPPPDEENKPMDIDYPLEYESDEPEETDETDDGEEETEEVAGTAQAALASGVGFEELGNAVRTINRKGEATTEQKRAAGNTLLEIRQTDMFEQLVSQKPDARETIASLMSASLTAFHKRKDREAGNTGSGRKAPESFDMRDFA